MRYGTIILVGITCLGLIGFAGNSVYGPALDTIGTNSMGFNWGDGEMQCSYGVAVNSTGWIFTGCGYGHRISLFDNSTDHTFASQFHDAGNRGNGTFDDDDELDSPHAMVFDSSDNLWVVDSDNSRILKFDGDATLLLKFGSYCNMYNGNSCNTSAPGAVAKGDGQFYSPYGIALDSSENIWIADSNNDRIQKFDSSGNFLLKINTGSGNSKYDSCYSGSGDFRLTAGYLCSPTSVAVDSSDNLYVAGGGHFLVNKFDSSGNHISQLGDSIYGGHGTTPRNYDVADLEEHQLVQPSNIFIDSSDNIYVRDPGVGNRSVKVFDNSFNYKYTVKWVGESKGQIIVDSLDRLLVGSAATWYGIDIFVSSSSTADGNDEILNFEDKYTVKFSSFNGTKLNKITVPIGNMAASLEFADVLNQTATDTTNKNIHLPNRIVVNATTADAGIDLIIQAGTSINGTNWNGGVELANNIDKSTISVSGKTINMATSFGSDDVDLTFSKPMKLKFDGLGDQKFGYVNSAGIINSTQTACLEDSFSSATSTLGGSGQCSITVGDDLIAYVYHFTKFFSFSDTPTAPVTSNSKGGSNCDSNGFGKNNSLRVYQVTYNIDTYQVQVQAYSTCGSISAKMTTPTQQSMLGLSLDQPYMYEKIVVYSGYLDESDEKFNIVIQNKKHSFDETFYIYDKSITKKYTGDTGYTSEQQGTISPTVTSKQITILPQSSVTTISQTIMESVTTEYEKQSFTEKLAIQPVGYTPEPVGYTPEPVAKIIEETKCGVGTESVNGICKVIIPDEIKSCFLFWCW